MAGTVDYNAFSRNGAPPPRGVPSSPGDRWWEYEKEKLARSLQYRLVFIREHQVQRITQWVISTRLYGNMALVGRSGVTFSRVAATQPWLKERISWNCVQSSSDTVVARMAKNQPKPLFLTNGGEYSLQRKAKLLNQFVDGVFYENDAESLAQQAMLDATVWGDGVVKVFAENGRVKLERTIVSELWCDDLDGFYGKPQNLHHVRDVDRSVLAAKVKEWLKKDPSQMKLALAKVESAPASNPDHAADFIADKVEVCESWHLPSGPGANDGKHAITILDFTLIEEGWEHDYFPFARVTWSKRMYGFWGQGLAEQLQNIQLEINTILQTIKQSFWKGGTFRVFLPTGSRVVKEQITNQIASTISYSGDKPPLVVTPPLVQPEIFQHLNSLWEKSFDIAGVSRLSASSQKPAGLNSGRALREYDDIESDRFTVTSKNYEKLHLQLAKLVIGCVRDITKGGKKSYTVKTMLGGRSIREVDWGSINLKDDEFITKCYPVSSLPDDPAGRMETITEWIQAGWVTPRQGRRLMDFPDLQMAEGLANAAEDYLSRCMEQIVDEGKYVAPEPYDDLELAMEMGLEYYQRGKSQQLEPERLEMLRLWMNHVQAIKDQAAQKAAQMAAALGQGGPPQAKPGPPPTSQQLPTGPNTPGPGAMQQQPPGAMAA